MSYSPAFAARAFDHGRDPVQFLGAWFGVEQRRHHLLGRAVEERQSLSLYRIRPQHRNEEVRELIPADFGGVMICDRGRSYDAKELEGVAQQKCL